MNMFLDIYQSLIDKKISDSEIMESSYITENELKKYLVLSISQGL